jgi:outer membrane protein
MIMTKKLLQATLITTLLCGAASAPALAQMDGDWLSKERFQLRARAIGIYPDGDGTVRPGGLETDVSDAYTPEVDVTYFFTDNIAAELIAATAKHSIDAGNNDVGDTWILPPTVTLQYHFMPDQAFSPYIGAGINYSLFYGEDADAGFNDLNVDGGFGLALQAGFDYWLNDHWGVNLDIKYIDLDVDVDVDLGPTGLKADDVELNPVILGAGVSYRF